MTPPIIRFLNRFHPLWRAKRLAVGLSGVNLGTGTLISPWAVLARQGGRITIGAGTVIQADARLLAAGGSIVLGSNCSVNERCILYGHGGLVIGNDVRIAAGTIFIPANHCFDDPMRLIRTQGETRKGIIVGSDVWFGVGVIVLDGVNVADGCVVGAGSVLTKSTHSMGVYFGNPARRIRDRGALRDSIQHDAPPLPDSAD